MAVERRLYLGQSEARTRYADQGQDLSFILSFKDSDLKSAQEPMDI